MEFLDAVTEVVAIALRVTTPKDGHGFALQVHLLHLVNDVIPRGARAIFISSSVPSGATDNEAIIRSKVAGFDLPNIAGLYPRSLSDLPSNFLRVSCLRGKEGRCRALPEHQHGHHSSGKAKQQRQRAARAALAGGTRHRPKSREEKAALPAGNLS